MFPYTSFEGIKIHDWSKWEDPFRLTVDAYTKYQAEKDKRLYAVLDGFAQSQGHLQLTDASLPQRDEAVPPGRHAAGVPGAPQLRLPRPAPQRPGPAVRVAVPEPGRDAARPDRDPHASATTTSTTRGFHYYLHQHDRVWYLSVPKSFFDDARDRRPVRVPDRDRVLLRVPADEPAVRAVHVRRVLQRRPADDDVRLLGPVRRVAAHDARARGDQVPARAGPGQRADRAALDRQVVLAGLPGHGAGRPDARLHAAAQGDELEGGVRALLRGADARTASSRTWRTTASGRRAASSRPSSEKEILSHQVYWILYQFSHAAAFTTSVPSDEHHGVAAGAATPTPSTSTTSRCGRRRSGTSTAGGRHFVRGLPQLCQVCQIPMGFTEPGDPTTLCQRSSDLRGRALQLLLRRLPEHLRPRAGEVRPGLAAGAPDLPGQLRRRRPCPTSWPGTRCSPATAASTSASPDNQNWKAWHAHGRARREATDMAVEEPSASTSSPRGPARSSTATTSSSTCGGRATSGSVAAACFRAPKAMPWGDFWTAM